MALLQYDNDKYKEIKHLEEHISTINEYEIIVALGSFSFSNYLFKNHYETFKNKKFIFCDDNNDLINFYNYIKSLSFIEFEFFIKKYNELIILLKKKFKKNNKNRFLEWFNFYAPINEQDKQIKFLLEYNTIKLNKKYCYFKKINFKNIEYIYSLLCNTDIFHLKIEDTINFFKDLKNAFFYIDYGYIHITPPYMLEDDIFYTDDYADIFENIYYFMKNKDCIFRHEYNEYLNEIFKENKLLEYNNTKIYSTINILN